MPIKINKKEDYFYKQGYRDGMEEVRKERMAEGIDLGAKIMALHLKCYSIETIAKKSGVSASKIQSLINLHYED